MMPLAQPPVRAVIPFLERHVRRTPSVEQFGGRTITVGTQKLQACTLTVPGYCGHLTVPLNWLDSTAGTITIRYQWIPARNAARSEQTIVAEEGGPGYSTTGTGAEYARLFAPLLGTHNLLMMDQRGTGGSAVVDCPALQPWGGDGVITTPFLTAVAQCGAQLNHTYRRSSGGFVHASDLFGTSQSVRDLAAILRALQLGRVDYYGDSYGSFFGQVFASRYPQLLNSVVLDSTYPTIDQDPFDRAGLAEIRFGFNAVCERSLACSAVAPGSAIDRLHRLAVALDRRPLVTDAYAPDGRKVHVRIAAPDLYELTGSAGDDYGPYRNLDAAARAYLERGDAIPLARLFVWTTYFPQASAYGVTEFSMGLEMADSCTVYTNPFDINAPIGKRRAQYVRAVAALPPWVAYPLSISDLVHSPEEAYDECLTWPAPAQVDPIVTKQPPIVPPRLPILIVSGDLDETTSPGDARRAAGALGRNVVFASLPNEIHVPALDDPYDCAAAIVVAFVAHPGPANTQCGASIPEVRTVGTFPMTLADQPPASPRPGNAATSHELALAALAVEAIGDTRQASLYNYEAYYPNCGADYCGPGLRGGRYSATYRIERVTLSNVIYAAGTNVSGTFAVNGALAPGYPGAIYAVVDAAGADGTRIKVTVHYDERVPRALATIRGQTRDGRRIAATFPAP
ncbi:MAG TPA: alpha/beta fold hydrolase [Candidatus Acidoferrales bacterium]|jgi:pimeloyl-ACP methyl ester carboxylesterase|nr:alpha/beta fold hydrolase [Candidatus Acidoferrales bacterium]